MPNLSREGLRLLQVDWWPTEAQALTGNQVVHQWRRRAPNKGGRMAEEETEQTLEEIAAAAAAAEAAKAEEEKPGKVDDADRKTWESEARKHEARAKKAAKELEALQAKLAERDDADKTEQERAIDTARQEASEKARAEVLTELRNERLEVAVARLANGIKIKDGDEEKTVRFADPDDAVVHIERAIKSGDVDQDDIFDSEGKVQTDALTAALEDLLGRKPHLQANGDGRRSSGEADAGKGAGGSKSMEEMSVEEHLKRKQETRA